ncbi:nucleolar essential protein-related [Abeliophyllum distichum]|uniref:Nucleolar essential protein-related n=1 Tax=Abeliophyllum distichum TaxID=126358 RepID=A0ABD1QJU2_9LAMI
MVRPYKVMGQKRKKKEKYDREEESVQLDENDVLQSPKKAKTEEFSELDKENAEQVIDEMPGIPIVPADTGKKPGVIFILEKASLEIGKVGKSYQLLSSDEHANYLMKNKRNPAEYRPDIAFQSCNGSWSRRHIDAQLSGTNLILVP